MGIMIALNHILTGSAIALAIRQPLLVAPIAFASHFVLDVIPHYIYGEPWSKLFWASWTIDAVLSLSACLSILVGAPEFAFIMLLGGFCAELPDLLWVYFYTHGKPKHWFFGFHDKIQWSQTWPGLIVEVAYVPFILGVNLALLINHG